MSKAEVKVKPADLVPIAVTHKKITEVNTGPLMEIIKAVGDNATDEETMKYMRKRYSCSDATATPYVNAYIHVRDTARKINGYVEEE